MQLPVNRPVAAVHHHQRDGYGHHRIDRGQVNYHPNSLGGGCPGLASFEQGGYRHYQERVDGHKVRRRSESLKDHFSQATLFWNSMSSWEKQHIVDAFTFEPGKVDREHIRAGVVAHVAQVDGDLAAQVAENVGADVPTETATNHGKSSPALSQADQPQSPATRKVAVLVADGVDTQSLELALAPLREQGVTCELLAPRDATLHGADDGELKPDRAMVTMSSVLYDAVLVAGGDASVEVLSANGEAVHYAAEAYRHAKPVGAIGAGIQLLEKAPIPNVPVANGNNGARSENGVVTVDQGDVGELGRAFAQAIAVHRHHDRDLAAVPA